jgi:hypothetical protein
MKIHQLLSGVQLPITNEENSFIVKHSDNVRITTLDGRDQVLAQNLVRKGVYSISKDNNTLIRETNGPST